MKYLGSCKELKERYKLECDCCDSCHEDYDEEGYEMCMIETKEGYYHVCCSVSNAYEAEIGE